MTITATMISGIVTAAESAFPAAVLKMYYGDVRDHVVNVLRSDTTESSQDNDLAGIIPGLRGRLRLILSRCSPWEPPGEGDNVDLYTSADVLIGTFAILGHNDDPTATVRTLLYGEESA